MHFWTAIQMGLIKCSRVGCFASMRKCSESENYLSYCVLHSELRRFEHGFCGRWATISVTTFGKKLKVLAFLLWVYKFYCRFCQIINMLSKNCRRLSKFSQFRSHLFRLHCCTMWWRTIAKIDTFLILAAASQEITTTYLNRSSVTRCSSKKVTDLFAKVT